MDRDLLVDEILRGGRGVECVLRGDIRSGEGAPLKVSPAGDAPGAPPASPNPGGTTTGPADGGRAPTEGDPR